MTGPIEDRDVRREVKAAVAREDDRESQMADALLDEINQK